MKRFFVGAFSRKEDAVDTWTARMVRQVRGNPPECLAGFRVSPRHAEPWDDRAQWALACRCGESEGLVLGYPLKDFRPEYDGPETYLSPLGFLCSACGESTEMLDTDLHGYDAEVGRLEGARGRGTSLRGCGDRTQFPCPGCGSATYSVIAMCTYSHFDLIDEEPKLEPRAQEFFDAFACRGVCEGCGHDWWLAEFELA